MSNKRVKEVSNIDRLSALPDSIITRILSLLNKDESAMTAVLSRRWQHLWTQSPNFYFRQGNLTVLDFVARVNRTLLIICNSPHQLQHFAVEFAYTKPFASDVNAWAQFAVNNKVKSVSFLLNTKTSDHFHVLPQSMCSNSSLDYLAIKGCTIAPQRTIDWPCLTELYLEGVEVPQQLIAKILSPAGCPVLSDLTLFECWGFTSLEIKSKTLVGIEIIDHDHNEGGIINGPLLEISSPYVESLLVSLSCPERRKLRLTNIPSQVILTIELFQVDIESVEVMNNAKELLGSIHHVEEVELGVSFLEVLSCMVIQHGYDQFPQSTSRTSLKVHTDINELGDIHGILGLLESSPNLQKLVVEGKVYEMEPYNYNCTSASSYQFSDLLQLKTVIIKNFVPPNHGGEPMLTLVRILLKRTPVLEKIVIYGKEIIKSSPALDPFTILETMLGYPRSSQKASILLR